jgi:hypothetical protein
MARKKGEVFRYDSLSNSIQSLLDYRRINVCKCMSKDLIQYINICNSICSKCKVPNSIQHIETIHQIKLPKVEVLLESTKKAQESKAPRQEKINKTKEIIQPHLKKLRKYLGFETRFNNQIAKNLSNCQILRQ